MIDFPPGTTVGQTFLAGNGVTYMWTGAIWVATAGGGTSSGGDFCVSGSGALGTTLTTGLLPTLVSGNSGGWYSSSTGRFTPPAGRYYLYAEMAATNASGATTIQMIIRKNATTTIANALDAVSVANGYGFVSPFVVVDANGTDFFDIQAAGVAAGTTSPLIMFGAFPISGIKGPPGDPPTAGGGIVRDTTLVSVAASIDFFDLPVRTVELSFYCVPVSPPATLALRVASGSTVNAGSVYNTQRHYATTATPGADSQLSQGYYLMSSAVPNTGCFGKVHLLGPSVGTLGSQGVAQVFNYSSTILQLGLTGPSGNGFQLLFTAGNLAAGSYCRVIGWP